MFAGVGDSDVGGAAPLLSEDHLRAEFRHLAMMSPRIAHLANSVGSVLGLAIGGPWAVVWLWADPFHNRLARAPEVRVSEPLELVREGHQSVFCPIGWFRSRMSL